MNILKQLLCGAVFSCIVFTFSCQKEEQRPPTPPVTNPVCTMQYADYHYTSGAFAGRDTLFFDAQNKYLGRRFGNQYIRDYAYDAQNRLMSFKVTDGNPPSTRENRYTYNSNNLRIQDDWYSNGFKLSIVLYEYDASNRVARTTRALYNGSTVTGRDTTTYVYAGAFNRPASLRYTGGARTDYTYDSNGNQTGEYRYAANGLPSGSFTYTFDNKKNPLKYLSFGNTIFPSKELLDPNNPISKTTTNYNQQGIVQSTSTYSYGVYEYNAQDYPSKLTAVDGSYWIYNYQCQ